MRIIHVAGLLGIGGLQKMIYHVALEQKSRGHHVEIYIFDQALEWVDYFRRSGLIVHTPVPKKKGGYDFNVVKRMRKDLLHFDIIHCHEIDSLIYAGPAYFLRKYFRKKSPKVILTTHGLSHIDNHPRLKLYEFIFSRMADKITGVSEKIESFYLKEMKTNSNKVSLIQNGISTFKGEISKELRQKTKNWLADRHQLDSQRPIILSLSRVLPLKNQKFLIEALKKRPAYQLIIVGPPSDQQYFDELKNLEDDNIKLLGAQELVIEYNMGSDLYVSASTHEGIPVAVLEAMSVETPCLISDIPGHKTLMNHGTSIETFNLENMDEFLLKFDLIFSNKELSKKNAMDGRTLVEKYYSVIKMVDQYLEVYNGK